MAYGYRFEDSSDALKEAESEMSGQEKDSDLHALLASLPEEERVILTLFYIKSHSAEEIASLLGVPVRAVESVLLAGRHRLLSALGIEGQ